MAPRPRFSLLEKKKQNKILDSAIEEFGTYGYDGASINRIIKNAGISKGVAYYYFDDKKDIFATVIEHSFKKIMNAFGHYDITQSTSDTYWDEMEAFVQTAVHLFRDQKWLRKTAKLFWHYVDTHPDSVAIRSVWEHSHSQIETIIKHGQKLGAVRSDIPNDLLITLIFGVGTAVDRWFVDNMESLTDEDIERVANFAFDSYKAIVIARDEELTSIVKKTKKKTSKKNKKKKKKAKPSTTKKGKK